MNKYSKLIRFNKKYSINFIYAYFLLSALKGLSNMLGHEMPFTIISDIGILFLTLEFILNNKSKKITSLILATIIIIILTSFFNSYSTSVLISGIRWQLFYMLAFFVGMNKYFDKYKFFSSMLWVIFFVDIIGVYLYIFPPEGYMEFKLQGLELNYISDNLILEMSRLSAFWPFPYWVSYGSACSYYYVLCRYFNGEIKTSYAILFILFFLCILLLAQQRLPLIFVICATLTLFVYSIFSHTQSLKTFNKGILFVFTSVIIIFLLILPIVADSNILDFGINKIDEMLNSSDSNNKGNFLTSRFDLFLDHINIKGSSLYGSGLGSYTFNPKAQILVLDNMWLAIFLESGIIGIFLYLLIFFLVIKKGVKRIKHNLFELGILSMFLLAMFGANCLSKNTQHPIIFWICCGEIFNQYYSIYRKKISEKNNIQQKY